MFVKKISSQPHPCEIRIKYSDSYFSHLFLGKKRGEFTQQNWGIFLQELIINGFKVKILVVERPNIFQKSMYQLFVAPGRHIFDANFSFSKPLVSNDFKYTMWSEFLSYDISGGGPFRGYVKRMSKDSFKKYPFTNPRDFDSTSLKKLKQYSLTPPIFVGYSESLDNPYQQVIECKITLSDETTHNSLIVLPFVKKVHDTHYNDGIGMSIYSYNVVEDDKLDVIKDEVEHYVQHIKNIHRIEFFLSGTNSRYDTYEITCKKNEVAEIKKTKIRKRISNSRLDYDYLDYLMHLD